jgi:hypothetical protein
MFYGLKIRREINILLIGMQENPAKRRCPARTWVKRFGAAGFVFFLVKGLLWLIIPAVVAYFSLN